MIPYSLLDLAPVAEGQTVAEALANVTDLARHAEALGYRRFWLAEHHNMTGIASAATALMIGHVAGATSTIRVGAGGIMLPNHSPLMVAEQFGTLATLYPDRIDLGLGRAPGTDGATAHALRRNRNVEDHFPNDVVELMGYLGDPEPNAPIVAVPGAGTHVPIWILGSSLFGAQLAAYLGLPYAFASHFAPAALREALHAYRQGFRPSAHLDRPHFMLAVNVFAADTDEEGAYLRSSMIQAFANLRTGHPGPLPRPVRDITSVVPPHVMPSVEQALSVTAVGSAATIQRQLSQLIADYAPDEVILTGQIHDTIARKRSFEIAANIMGDLRAAA